jgi:hypothetical protein
VIKKAITRGVEEAKKGGDMVDFINSLREYHSKYQKWQIMGIGGSDGETLATYPLELQETKTFSGLRMRMTDWKLRGSWTRSNPAQLHRVLMSMKTRRINRELRESSMCRSLDSTGQDWSGERSLGH